LTQHSKSGQGHLILEVSRSHAIIHTNPSQRPLPTQHITNTGDSQRDSNPQSQQPSGSKPTPSTARHRDWLVF